MEIGRGIGKYEKVGQSGAGKQDFEVKITRGQYSRWQYSTEAGSKGGVSVPLTKPMPTAEIAYTIPKAAEGREWRLRGFGKDGKALNLMHSSFFPAATNGLKSYTTLAYVAPEEVGYLVLEARDYEWTAIKNLPLYPRE